MRNRSCLMPEISYSPLHKGLHMWHQRSCSVGIGTVRRAAALAKRPTDATP